VTWPAADALKQQIPLLDYLQSLDWKPARRISRGRLMGLCPLHRDHQPSFLVDQAGNNLLTDSAPGGCLFCFLHRCLPLPYVLTSIGTKAFNSFRSAFVRFAF